MVVKIDKGDDVGEYMARPRSRASKQVRRQQLINATIDSLAKRGYAETTMAHVTEGAKLSRGIANFHFESKGRLLIETLQFMADEYDAHWKAALERAGSDPAARMRALMVADFDRNICNSRKIAAWFAFISEAKTRPIYRELCWSRDDDFRDALHSICLALKKQAQYAFNAENTAAAIYSLQEGLWMRLMLTGKDFPRQSALETSLSVIGTFFPRHFHPDGSLLPYMGAPVRARMN